MDYYHHVRPHQGITQALPAAIKTAPDPGQDAPTILAVPMVGGLHHDDRLERPAFTREIREDPNREAAWTPYNQNTQRRLFKGTYLGGGPLAGP